MLILPKYRELYAPEPIVHLGPSVEGYYTFEAVGPDGRRRPLGGVSKNLVTSVGLNQLGSTNAWMDNCFVGTGNTPPTTGDVSLNSYKAAHNSVVDYVYWATASAPYYWTYRKVFRFNQGTATGNLTEVGVGPAANSLTSRSLILDGSGNPTTITVLAIEQLDVTYDARFYLPTGDVTGQVTLDGVLYNWTGRAMEIDGAERVAYAASATNWTPGNNNTAYSTSAEITSITTAPPKDSSATVSNSGYGSNTYYIQGQFFFGINNGNHAGGIRTISALSNRGSYQFRFGVAAGQTRPLDATIPKTNTQELRINARCHWVRHV